MSRGHNLTCSSTRGVVLFSDWFLTLFETFESEGELEGEAFSFSSELRASFMFTSTKFEGLVLERYSPVLFKFR